MSRRGIVLFASMCVIWGIPYLMIRVAVREITPATLVFLRTAGGLAEAGLKPSRIRRALTRLRGRLPDGRPLTAVRLAVEGGRVVVEEGARRWQPESGQILFDFGVADLAKKTAPFVRRAFRAAQHDGEALSADDWYEWGCELERGSPAEAIDAYRRALALDPSLADAHVNLGRLHHGAGRFSAAEAHYRAALAAQPSDGIAAFNLAVALDDQGRAADALVAYHEALALDPGLADAHFNLARLHERRGERMLALRHLKEYRSLAS